MDCVEFRARYTEFRDATVVTPRERRRFERHLARCPACRRHDAALREGVATLRTAAPVMPSAGFRRRLEARLAAERIGWARRRAPLALRLAAGLLAAVAMTLLATEATPRSRARAAPALPPVAFPKPVVNPGVPLVTFQDPRASVLAGNPHPYGTAFVEPAAARR
jgi:anti-sigma factor RsiW